MGRHAAGATCLLYIGLPKAVHVAAVPMVEALLLPAFLSALAFAAWACQDRVRCGRRAAVAGLLAAVAYLIRPEGLVAAAAAGCVLVFARGARLRRALSARTGFEVKLDVEVDPSLIAGAVATVGGLVFDGSLRTQIEQLRANLMKGS